MKFLFMGRVVSRGGPPGIIPVINPPAPRTKISVAQESIWKGQDKAPAPNRGAAFKAHTWDGAALLSDPHSLTLKNARHMPSKKDQRARPCGAFRTSQYVL